MTLTAAPLRSGPTAPRANFARRGGVVLALAMVGALVVAAHAPVLRSKALCFDDSAFVTRNRLVMHPGWASVGRFFGEVLEPSTVKGYYLPLAMTSLMLDVAAGGGPANLAPFHRSNLVLHVACTLLLVLVLRSLFGALLPAVLAGLLFGLHPLTVEPVAWIGERKTLLATAFALASLLAWLPWARGARGGWRALSVALFALALLSKPTAVTLPLLLLLLDVWPLRRFDRRAVLEKWPFLLLAGVSAAITMISHQRTAGLETPGAGGALQWPVHAAWLLAFYVRKMAWPGGLSPVYPPPAPFTFANPAVVGSVALVLVLTAALVRIARRAPGPLVAWAIFVIAIAPTLGLVKYSWVIASDKYVYFPALGPMLLVGAGLTAAWNARPWRAVPPRAAVLAAAIALLATETRGVRAALEPWSDSLTLFRHMERTAPDSPSVLNEIGLLLAERGRYADALPVLQRTVGIQPNFGEAHDNLGIVLAGLGRYDEAAARFREAEPLLPGDPDAPYNLGMALALSGRFAEAEEPLRRALRLDPVSVRAHNQLGGVLVHRGRLAEAVAEFRAAIALAPGDPDLHFRLASALLMAGGQEAEGARELRAANRLRPDWPQGLNALAWLLATVPDPSLRAPEEALRLAARANELGGGRNPQVLDTVAAAQAAAGRFDEAADTARRAAELARAAHSDPLARAIAERARLYASGRAYTEPPQDTQGP